MAVENNIIECVRLMTLAAFMTAASIEDIRTMKIPNRIVLTGAMAGIFITALSGGRMALAYVALELFFIFLFGTLGIMGMGDLKLWMMATTFIPLKHSAAGVSIGAAFLIAYGLIRDRRYIPQKGYPFAPFMTVGMIIAWILRFRNVY